MALFQFYGGWSNWGGGYFNNFVYWLDYWGVRDIILPFILIFTIFFAMLQKINLFGATGSKKYNMVISLAVALLVVIPHALGAYPPEADVINIINDSIPEVALLVVVVVLVLMLLGMVAGKEVRFAGVLPWVAGISVLLLLFIFADAIFPFGITNYIDPAIQSLIVILLVFGLLIYWVAGEPSAPSKSHMFWLGPTKKEDMESWFGEKKE